jgi:hypothetical protein
LYRIKVKGKRRKVKGKMEKGKWKMGKNRGAGHKEKIRR